MCGHIYSLSSWVLSRVFYIKTSCLCFQKTLFHMSTLGRHPFTHVPEQNIICPNWLSKESRSRASEWVSEFRYFLLTDQKNPVGSKQVILLPFLSGSSQNLTVRFYAWTYHMLWSWNMKNFLTDVIKLIILEVPMQAAEKEKSSSFEQLWSLWTTKVTDRHRWLLLI